MKRDQSIALELFSSGGNLKLYKTWIKKLGLKPALYLAYLLDKYNTTNKLEDNAFPLTNEEQLIEFGNISPYHLLSFKKVLKLHDLLELIPKGIPPKIYYKLNIPKVIELTKDGK